jgi:hypothetical protein
VGAHFLLVASATHSYYNLNLNKWTATRKTNLRNRAEMLSISARILILKRNRSSSLTRRKMICLCACLRKWPSNPPLSKRNLHQLQTLRARK